MEFRVVIQTCLDFSIASGGTIQSYPAGQQDRLVVQSRTTRTDILVERCLDMAGHWWVELRQDAMGDKTLASARVSTADGLQAQLQSFWDKDGSNSRGEAGILSGELNQTATS